MSKSRPMGSQVQLTFQSKFPTFTAEQFNRIIKEKNYFMMPSQIVNTLEPQAPPIQAQIFSKGDVSVFLILSQNQINFQILNTVNLKTIIEQEIKPILVGLKIRDEVISQIVLQCTVVEKAKEAPQKDLTQLVKENFLEGVSKTIGKKLGVITIRLGTEFPTGRDGIQVVLEPLGTSPKDQYFVNILFQTTKMVKFHEFISKFGDNMIQGIIEEVNQNVS